MYGLLNRRKLKLIGSKVMPIKRCSSGRFCISWLVSAGNCVADSELAKLESSNQKPGRGVEI